jgi:RNA polymerase sigma-70 factor, ECF subfamily
MLANQPRKRTDRHRKRPRIMNTEQKFHVSSEQIRSEEAEIEAARKDPQRFGVLYNRYYARILGFVYQRVESKEEAYDITAQVFMNALEQLSKYKSQGVPFSAWLFRIAINELHKFWRKAKVRQTINIDDTQVGGKLMQAMQQLAPEEIQLLEMRFFEKRPFKEICDILNISETACKARTYRLFERLKTILTSMS